MTRRPSASLSASPSASTAAARVSLAEVVAMPGNESLLDAGESQALIGRFTECLSFSPRDGRIWLNDQRMILMHTASLGTLRRELIETVGLARARGLLTRAGYDAGERDARLVREQMPDGDLASVFMAGTQLHALEGVVQVVPVSYEIAPERGHYFGEFLWYHSSEDDEHISAYGIGTEPACWMQIGYAMGYVTGLMGRLVVFREVECRSMGADHCRVVGKVAEAWGDVSEDLRYLNAQDFLAGSPVAQPPQAVLGSGVLLAAQTADAREGGAADAMVGTSSAFKAACHMLTRVAPTKATVLFTGESGVGKEMFARTLHRIGQRQDKAFIALNCAAIPESLIEAELFGVERGAYTGATASRPGRFERADGGTLFLDEIGTLSLTSQGKLLRALQEGEIERIGGARTIRVDVRVIAATNVDLRAEVQAGRFREDLFYRLDVYPIHLPPLRERREDIPLLLSHFFQIYCRTHGRALRGYAPRAVRALMTYPFPGNIRELQNMVERGVISADEGGVIELPHMLRKEQLGEHTWLHIDGKGGLTGTAWTAANPAAGEGVADVGIPPTQALFERVAGADGRVQLDALEQRLLQEAIARAGGNQAAAARLLGITRAQLRYRLGRQPKQAGAPRSS